MASELEVGKIVAKTPATTGSSPLEVARLEVKDEGVNMVTGMGPKMALYMPHTTASFEGASIAAKKEDDSDTHEATSLVFSTCPNAGTNTERLSINSTGHIILPTAGQTIKTDLSSGSTTRTAIIELYNGTTGALSLKTDNNATGGIELWTEGARRLNVQRNGVCAFNNGIAFTQTNTSATGATATGTTLDHFETGTFTPTFSGGTTAGTYTIGTAVGKYTRIGNMVTVNVSLINITESSAGSGQVIFGGFPFASGSSSTQGYIGAARVRSYTDAGSSPIVYMGGGATVATMSQYSSGTADQICQVSGISSGNTDISFSLTYFV